MGLLDYEQLMSSPLLQAGLGILANNNSRNFGQVIGGGLQQGLGNVAQFQQMAQKKKQQEQEQQMRQQQFDMQNKQFEMQKTQWEQAQEKERKRQAVMSTLPQTLGIPSNVLEAYPEIGQKYLESNLVPKTPKISDISPDKFTPESLAAFASTNDFTKLVPVQDASKAPSAVQEYEYAKKQGYRGSFLDFQLSQKRAGASNTTVSYGAPVSGVDAQGNPVFFQPSKNGGAPAIVPGVAPPKVDKPATEAQAKAATFHSQMTNASKQLATLEQEGGYNPSTFSDQVATGMATGAGNLLVGSKAQRARQAQNQWAESFLRIKTGAAATKEEVRMNVETFFPQPGDTADTIAQKAIARKQAEEDVASMRQNPNNIVPSGAKMENKPRSKKDILQQYGITGGT